MNIDSLIKKEINSSNSIKELYLYQLPMLKQCKDWNFTQEVGLVDFQGKHYHYEGALIILNERYYFITQSTIRNLNPYRKWKFKRQIYIFPTEIKKIKK